MLLLKYYTYNRGAAAQTLSAGGPGLIAPGGTPGKIKWPELGVTELRFRDRLDPADSDLAWVFGAPKICKGARIWCRRNRAKVLVLVPSNAKRCRKMLRNGYKTAIKRLQNG